MQTSGLMSYRHYIGRTHIKGWVIRWICKSGWHILSSVGKLERPNIGGIQLQAGNPTSPL